MNAAARRNAARRGWPRGLYEPRPGYYTWRHPTTGETLPIGRVSLAVAKSEALAANLHVEGLKPSLIERVASNGKTVADVLDKMPAAKTDNTRRTWKSQDKVISESLGQLACEHLTTVECADLIEGIEATGKHRWAQAIRSRLIAVCQRAQQLGWMNSNPAEPTRLPDVTVKRGRLTLESWQAIRAQADNVAECLGLAMDLALVTGADRATIAGLTRKNIGPDWLEYKRSKTGVRVRVPLAITLDTAGLHLQALVRAKRSVVTQHLVHHVKPWGNAPTGAKVHPDRISHAFTEARKLANIPDAGAPTFHELRSLAKRLYQAQGNVDTKALLGHLDETSAQLYADPRGVEALVVRVTPSERQVNLK